MIVWVNGAFGVGKSHTAAELVRRVPGAVLSDSEPVRFSLQPMQPKPLRTDFQEISGWRSGIREVIAGLDADGRWPVVEEVARVVGLQLVRPALPRWRRGTPRPRVAAGLIRL